MGLFVALRLELDTAITHFLAGGEDTRLLELSRDLADSELTRTVILVVASTATPAESEPESEVDASDAGRKRAIAAAAQLAEALAAHEEVAWVRSGWRDSGSEAVHELYFPRRVYFTAATAAGRDAALSEAGLRAAAERLESQLRLPTAALVKQVAPRDPLLLYPALLERVEQDRADTLEIVDGQFVTPAGEAVLFLASKHSPFRAEYQASLQAAIAATFAELAAQDDTLTLRQSGVGRFALRAESRIRADIQRISVVSTLGVVALFLLLFRGPRLVLLALVPLAAGVLTATATCLAAFGTIHGLTLAFGASLIGICIDYPVHLFNHHVLEPDAAGPRGTVRRVRPGLLLGAATTVAGFVGLGWAAFPGVREIAVFAAVGVTAALAATLYLLPPLMRERPPPVAIQRKLADGAARVLAALRRRRSVMAVLPLAALGVIAIALPRVAFDDRVAALTETDADLLAEDESVRALVSRMDAGRMIVAIGDDDEAALCSNDAIHARLVAAREAGELEAFVSLHDLLWSVQLQRDNLAAYLSAPASLATHPSGGSEREAAAAFGARLDAAFVAAGFRTAAFAPFTRDLEALAVGEGAAPLTVGDLQASPLATFVDSLRVELDGQIAILTRTRGLADTQLLRERLADIEGALVFDQQELLEEIYGSHRRSTLRLVALGLLAVLAMIALRYRRVGATLAAFAPALLAAGTAVAVLTLAGFTLNLFHVVSLLLVLSMGVDYGVFLAESHGRTGDELAATLLSLLACCMSTVLAFGLLAMSSNPALRAVGLTVGLGVLASLLLAPTSLILMTGAASGRPGPARRQPAPRRDPADGSPR